MGGDLQHCPSCREEYVAGIAACVECGEPLHAGPLPRGGAAPAAGTAAAASGGAELDRLLADMPGREADYAVRALLLEGIACRVECQGIVKVYQPDQRPAEPFAVTLPVTVYVAAAKLEDAQEILTSLQEEDVIGEQWSEAAAEADGGAGGGADVADDRDAAAAADAPAPAAAEMPEEVAGIAPPVAQSTTLRTIVLIVVVGLFLLLLFAR